jgi:hypothetical protein
MTKVHIKAAGCEPIFCKPTRPDRIPEYPVVYALVRVASKTSPAPDSFFRDADEQEAE